MCDKPGTRPAERVHWQPGVDRSRESPALAAHTAASDAIFVQRRLLRDDEHRLAAVTRLAAGALDFRAPPLLAFDQPVARVEGVKFVPA